MATQDIISEDYPVDPRQVKIDDYGFGKEHDPRSVDIFRFIEYVDLVNGDAFYFKSGGDGDNGTMLMDLLDSYFKYRVDKKPLP